MNSTKSFFTLVLFFTFGFFTQTRAANTVPAIKVPALHTITIEQTPSRTKTNRPAESNTAPTKTQQTQSYSFYFKYKQFMKPVVRKSALC